MRINPSNMATATILRTMALIFNCLPRYRAQLKNSEGWINFSVGIRTEDGCVEQAIIFDKGRVRVSGTIPDDADVVMQARDRIVLKEMAAAPPNEMLIMMLHNKILLQGNIVYLQLFNYYLSLLIGGYQQRLLDRVHRQDMAARKVEYGINDPKLSLALKSRRSAHLTADSSGDENVRALADPYLAQYSLEDFPRLEALLKMHLEKRPALCAERPEILTAWYRENGFEEDRKGQPWQPVLRQGLAFEYLMRNKRPVIAENQLLAGTTTTREACGVIVYPDAQGALIWGELRSIDKRHLNPYDISAKTRDVLNDIFPFWAGRNFREWTRTRFDNPPGLQIDERFVAYFCWKSVGLSHTVPDFRAILEKGTRGLAAEIKARLQNRDLDSDGRASLEAMGHTLRGLEAYAASLAGEARRLAGLETDGRRQAELLRMAELCEKVPRRPAATLDEAFQSIWTVWIGMHMENTNTGLSIGRIDQWLQPYFLADVEQLQSAAERQAWIRHVIELAACFYLRLTDHMPLSPDIGNYLFGGSPANQAITLGGMTRDGKDGVNNMYAEIHADCRPTPFLSAMIDGCIEKGRDITWGGARYNTSGSSNIGLADVTDSLMVVKKLVFDDQKLTFTELKAAIDSDFKGHPGIQALVRNKVPLFGSGDAQALALANRVTDLVHSAYAAHTNYRGGCYTSGFWSMSQHVAYGNLSGTLPSGRLAGRAFTPGLTPEPHASRNYLDFITDVAGLAPENMDNNMAFNVKLAPAGGESRSRIVGNMAGYVKAYCARGGMQMQFNVVNSRVLKDAMANPENYRNLIVRISGYNAYFVTLNRQQQIELIERAEYGV